jgi:hypothetical protein
MLNRLPLAVLALAGTIWGCTSTCQRGQDTGKALQTKYAACSQAGGPPFMPVNDAQVKTCEQNFGTACSVADQKLLDQYFNCIGTLPNCTLATQNDWITAWSTCTNPLIGVSAACNNVFN